MEATGAYVKELGRVSGWGHGMAEVKLLYNNLNVAILLCLFLIIYFTYNSVNTTTKDNSFVYSDMFRL